MIDLMIPLKEDRSVPYYEQIYHYIKGEIRTGRIAAGERLPSIRKLSEKMSVSRSTAQMAYDQLVAEGYLEARPYRGYFAAEVELLLGELGKQTGDEMSEEIGASEKSQETAFGRKALIDFSPRGIDLSRFPSDTWRRLSREVLQEEYRDLFQTGSRRGERNLRQAVCDYLLASRGIHTIPERVVIGAGTEYLLMLLTQITGIRRVAMENPTYRQASRVLASLGHTIVPVALDQYGMRPDLLAASGAEIAYLMPSHQFPTGAVMPVSRRQEALAWAAEKDDRYLIEDDYDSEFRYRGKPIPAMAGLSSEAPIVYMGTFSKSVAPAIRVSYMVLPEALNNRYDALCGFYSPTVSRIDQEILTRFMEGGYFERHLNRMRSRYKAKHDRLIQELDPLKAEFELSGERAGLHLLLKSRMGIPEEELIERAEKAGVVVYGLSEYFLEPAKSHTVLLGFANLREEEIVEGTRRLREVW